MCPAPPEIQDARTYTYACNFTYMLAKVRDMPPHPREAHTPGAAIVSKEGNLPLFQFKIPV